MNTSNNTNIVKKTNYFEKTNYSKKTNVGNTSKSEIPSYDFFLNNSVESLLQYIRFDAFMSFDDKKKKELFYNLSYIGCREPETLKQILEFIHQNDFKGLAEFAKNTRMTAEDFLKNTTCEIPKEEAEGLDIESAKFIYFKKPETIIDGWFEESDQTLASALLHYLCFVINDDKGIQSFMKYYLSMSPALRMELVSGENHLAYAI